MSDHYILDPSRLLKSEPILLRVLGKKPNWLQSLMVYLATGWT